LARTPAPWTRDELLDWCANDPERVVNLVFALWDRIDALTQQVETLTQRVNELSAQVHQNSQNSHKPPSADGPQKPAPRSLRTPSGKPSGGQEGHPGARLEMREHPDITLIHRPETCAACGGTLEGSPAVETERRQVFDLVVHMDVTEHQAVTVRCPACQSETVGTFPATVVAPTQYGPALRTFLAYANVYQFIPAERMTDFIADLTGHRISEGTLYYTLDRLAGRLAPFDADLRRYLQTQDVLHFDESGLRIAGKTHWIHSASSWDATRYVVSSKRGQKGIEAAGVLPTFTGTAVHDGWPAYWMYGQCVHGLCNVHHERELQAVIETTHQTWAQDLIDHLHTIKRQVREAVALGQHALPDDQRVRLQTEYDRIVAEGMQANPRAQAPAGTVKRGRVKQTKARNLLERLHDHADAVLRFMTDFRVPYTNNQAEQDIRMIKVHQKVAGTFRSATGAETFCQIRSYISTLKKRDLPVWEGLQQALAGNPYRLCNPAPDPP